MSMTDITVSSQYSPLERELLEACGVDTEQLSVVPRDTVAQLYPDMLLTGQHERLAEGYAFSNIEAYLDACFTLEWTGEHGDYSDFYQRIDSDAIYRFINMLDLTRNMKHDQLHRYADPSTFRTVTDLVVLTNSNIRLKARQNPAAGVLFAHSDNRFFNSIRAILWSYAVNCFTPEMVMSNGRSYGGDYEKLRRQVYTTCTVPLMGALRSRMRQHYSSASAGGEIEEERQ